MGSKFKVAGLLALGAVAGALTTMQIQAIARNTLGSFGSLPQGMGASPEVKEVPPAMRVLPPAKNLKWKSIEAYFSQNSIEDVGLYRACCKRDELFWPAGVNDP